MNFWENKRVLVTGGAGFIGSNVVEELLKKGSRITVVDNLKRGNLANLGEVLGKIDFVQKDLGNGNDCAAVCKGKDVVMHLASDAYGLSYSYTHHSEILNNNILLNTNLLDACRQEEIKRLLVVSSSCVYPDGSESPTKEAVELAGEPEKANVGYGWSKRILEIQARHLSMDCGMEIAVVRPANVYGPRDPITGKGTHVIPALISKALFENNEVISVWGSGNQSRDFIHVRDAAKAMIHVAENYAYCDPVNLGSMKPVSMKELIRLILKSSGVQKEVVFDLTKPEGAKTKAVDISLLEKIGFRPQISFEDGLKETIEFYVKNRG